MDIGAWFGNVLRSVLGFEKSYEKGKKMIIDVMGAHLKIFCIWGPQKKICYVKIFRGVFEKQKAKECFHKIK